MRKVVLFIATTLAINCMPKATRDDDDDDNVSGTGSQAQAERIRSRIARAESISEMRNAVREALTASGMPAPDDLVGALAREELNGSRLAISDMYSALRDSQYSIRLESGEEFTTDQFVGLLQETLAAARLAGPENLGWAIALGSVADPDTLHANATLRPTEAALVALSWSAAANYYEDSGRRGNGTLRRALSPPRRGALGVISAGLGAALWWGASVMAVSAGGVVAIVSAPAIVAAAAGLAIGIGAYMIGSAIWEATQTVASVTVGTTNSGNLVTGQATAQVVEEIAQQNAKEDTGGEGEAEAEGEAEGEEGEGESMERWVEIDASIILDQETGRVWQRNANSANSCSTASDYCSNLSLGGYTNWRMPSPDEFDELGLTDPLADGSCLSSIFEDRDVYCTWIDDPGWTSSCGYLRFIKKGWGRCAVSTRCSTSVCGAPDCASTFGRWYVRCVAD